MEMFFAHTHLQETSSHLCFPCLYTHTPRFAFPRFSLCILLSMCLHVISCSPPPACTAHCTTCLHTPCLFTHTPSVWWRRERESYIIYNNIQAWPSLPSMTPGSMCDTHCGWHCCLWHFSASGNTGPACLEEEAQTLNMQLWKEDIFNPREGREGCELSKHCLFLGGKHSFLHIWEAWCLSGRRTGRRAGTSDRPEKTELYRNRTLPHLSETRKTDWSSTPLLLHTTHTFLGFALNRHSHGQSSPLIKQ